MAERGLNKTIYCWFSQCPDYIDFRKTMIYHYVYVVIPCYMSTQDRKSAEWRIINKIISIKDADKNDNLIN